MYVGGTPRIRLKHFIWKLLIFCCCELGNCTVSNPYNTWLPNIAWKICVFHSFLDFHWSNSAWFLTDRVLSKVGVVFEVLAQLVSRRSRDRLLIFKLQLVVLENGLLYVLDHGFIFVFEELAPLLDWPILSWIELIFKVLHKLDVLKSQSCVILRRNILLGFWTLATTHYWIS